MKKSLCKALYVAIFIATTLTSLNGCKKENLTKISKEEHLLENPHLLNRSENIEIAKKVINNEISLDQALDILKKNNIQPSSKIYSSIRKIDFNNIDSELQEYSPDISYDYKDLTKKIYEAMLKSKTYAEAKYTAYQMLENSPLKKNSNEFHLMEAGIVYAFDIIDLKLQTKSLSQRAQWWDSWGRCGAAILGGGLVGSAAGPAGAVGFALLSAAEFC